MAASVEEAAVVVVLVVGVVAEEEQVVEGLAEQEQVAVEESTAEVDKVVRKE